jgi:hypothetical protein
MTEATHKIHFTENRIVTFIDFNPPKGPQSITTTLQLIYCIGLMNEIFNDDLLTEPQRQWLGSHDSDDLKELNAIAENIVKEFIRDELKNRDTIAEVTTLAPVLSKSSFKNLVKEFINKIHQSVLLEGDLLAGLGGLIRNAPLGYLDPDDLVQILDTLHTRLESTHQQSTVHVAKVIQAVSYILDSMVDSEVRDLNREQLHEPLSNYLKDLKNHSDPSLVYQAAYAYQALQHVPDDDTPLRKILRRTGKVIQGASGVLSAVKAMDIMALVEGLRNLHDGVTEIGNAAVNTLKGAKELYESGQDLLDSLKESLSTNKKGWYQALRGLDSLIQEGRFVEFEQLIREVPCAQDPVFRCGVYLRLESISRNEEIEFQNRRSAISYLTDLCRDNAKDGYNKQAEQWILWRMLSLESGHF